MTHTQPTEVLGASINAWDAFYSRHFKELYEQCLDICQNTLKAKELTDKILTKLLLADPSCVLGDKTSLVKSKLAILFPYYNVKVHEDKKLSAGRLLNLYYQANW